MRLFCILLVVAAAFCSSGRRPPSPLPRYEDALSMYRHGEFKACARALDAAQSAWLQPRDEEGWKWRLLNAELTTRMLHAPTAALELLDSEPPAGMPDVHALWHIRRSKAYFNSEEFDCARSEAEQARNALSSASPPAVRFEVGVYEALAAWQTGDKERGERAMERVGEEAAAADSPFDEATAFSNLVYFNYKNRRFDAAVRFGERAVAVAERAGARRVFASAATNLATNYNELGLYEKAAALLERAEPIAREVEDWDTLQDALSELGRSFVERAQYDKAISSFKEAYSWGSEENSITAADNLAYSYIALNKPKEADRWNELAQPRNPKKDTEDFAYYATNGAEIALKNGDLARAFDLCRAALKVAPRQSNVERGLHAQMGSLYVARKRLKEAKAEFEIALADVESGQRQLSDDSMRIGFLSRLIDNYQAYVDGLVANGEKELALQVAERSRARVLALRMGRGGSASKLNVRDLARRTGATLLSYWLAQNQSYLWVVTGSETRLIKLREAAVINKLVAEYRKTVETDEQDPLEDSAGKQLYAMLIQPAADLIPPNGRVIVVPDGDLHHINLESLPVPGPKPHYWLEDAVVSIAPALTLIEPGASSRSSERSVLAIGAPVTVDAVNYPELRGTRDEIENVRRLFGAAAEPVEGKEATPDALARARNRRLSIIHFAAHGESNETAPLESAVILSPNDRGVYKLYARDVKDLNLDADLVTISGCKSAGARSYAGEGLLGFAWAFLQSGARNVVAGLWDVGDRGTSELMRQFYEQIKAGEPPAEALHHAKVAMTRHKRESWRRAYSWAAFQCYQRSAPAASESSRKMARR